MHLRKIFLFIQLLFCLPLFAQLPGNGHFTLYGKINGDAPKEIKLAYDDINGQRRVDTVRVNQGKFEFKGTVNGPTIAHLFGKLTSKSLPDPNMTWFFLEPTSIEIEVTVDDFSSMIVRGSRLQDEYQKFNETERSLLQERKRLIDIDKKIQSQKNSKDLQSQKDSFNTQWSKYENSVRETRLKFIKEHNKSAVTAYLLSGCISSDEISPDSAEIIYNGFPETLKKALLGVDVKTEIIKKQTTIKGLVGTKAPLLNGLDINGKAIRSDAYIGKKYVLLNFWFTKCVPCHEEFPYINALYDKYGKTNLEIIGVSNDSGSWRADWKKDIVKSKISRWKHMLATDDLIKERGKRVLDRFYVYAFPTVVLIDKSGTIIYRSEGVDPEGIKKIDAILHSSAAGL